MSAKLFAACVAGTVLSVVTSAHALVAAPFLEYDASLANGGGASMSDTAPAAPAGSTISPNLPGTAIIYNASGANSGPGTKDHAYYDFVDVANGTGTGFIGNSNVDGTALNNGGAKLGYTMEAYLRIQSTASSAVNAGIGSGHGTGFENNFFRLQSGGLTFLSTTTTANAANDDFNASIDTNISGIIPLDRFFHLLKIHDPVAQEVQFWVDGVEVLTVPFVETGVRYQGRGEQLGNFGTGDGRFLEGVQYSLTRFYNVSLSESEVAERFAAVVPEPTSLGLLATAGAMLIARRRRQA